MRIAKPMLLVTTPVGVGWGIYEAARFHLWLAALMALLVGVVGAFFWMTVARIRRERAAVTISDAAPFASAPPTNASAAEPPAHRN
jgi:hypothetical protein